MQTGRAQVSFEYLVDPEGRVGQSRELAAS
jgi:hypothetical protein